MMAGKVTMTEIETGVVDLVDLLKINALLDMQAASEHEAAERARGER